MMQQLCRQLIFWGLVTFAVSSVRAQDSDAPAGGTDELERLFTEDDAVENIDIQDARSTKTDSNIKELSDLVTLAPFKDVAVIQKRYLPKTGRFELFAGINNILNNAFFNTLGVDARAAYYFRERFGVELIGMFLTTSERGVTTDLKEKRKVRTERLVVPKSYFGADFKWSPIYGKMAFANQSIIPFDMYFSVGGGMTGTNQEKSEPTLHLGTGQAFALGKSSAFRWDFSWNVYQARNYSSGVEQTAINNNLFIMLGMSFFVPEASYR